MSDGSSSLLFISLSIFAFLTLACISEQYFQLMTILLDFCLDSFLPFLALLSNLSPELFLDLFLDLFLQLDVFVAFLSLSCESLELSLYLSLDQFLVLIIQSTW